jgi:5-methyltetrahydrofolate--homocysteine methyltransferase
MSKNIKEQILEILNHRPLIIDGAMGTQIQTYKVPDSAWVYEGQNLEGCNELLNITAPQIISKIHNAYAYADADMIKTNTFGTQPWVLDEYGLGDKAYELSKLGAKLVKDICDQYSTPSKPRFVLGSIGPGTKLPSLGHITYDEMYEGYKIVARGLIDGGVDVFLLETCQDPLQIKAAIHAINDAQKEYPSYQPSTISHQLLPIMVSVTIELSGSMLIGTDAGTITTILEPFDILSLGFNCGTGPEQVAKHLKVLSQNYHGLISIHSNAGLPQNKGGYTYYPMGPNEFSALQKEFLELDGVSFLGGCCGTTPQHIKALSDAVQDIPPRKPTGNHEKSLASLFNVVTLKQEPAPLLIGERSNATGSKAFRDLLLNSDYEGTLSVAQAQVRSGAHILDVSVGFAGRDESKDMDKIVALYSQKIPLPLMPDSTQTKSLEIALKQIGGKPIINSVNLEDGIEKFDEVCILAKKFGASLVCLVIDEEGMAKTAKRKVEVAERIYQLATQKHGIDPRDLVFDMLVFTVGSGDDEYRDAAIQTIDAIREFSTMHPEIGTTLGLSNISFGLSANARIYLNSVFLHHCVKAGLTSAIVNVAHLLPIAKISEADLKICEDLLFDNRTESDPLFKFIDHFSSISKVDTTKDDGFELLSNEEKVKKLLIDGDKQRLLPLVDTIKDEVSPEIIVNVWLIEGMKVIGELFGSGAMQLPFVLQSAETMKATVDFLKPYLPKKEKDTNTTLVLGTVKGDVHDVGKNLVDIILSNNGFKVINIGIKADLGEFVKALKEHNADAIGMSGLLVKSTAVMKENLEELQKLGIKVPVLLGGAALTKGFIDDFCRPVYDGDIFYCRDAFDGVISMQRIEKGGELDTSLDKVIIDENKKEFVAKVKKAPIPHYDDITMPSSKEKILVPPFWGRRVLKIPHLEELAYKWINHRVLFRQRWGYRKKGKTTEEFLAQEEKVVKPLYDRLKNLFFEKKLFDPIALYGYYPCRRDGDSLLIFDEEFIYHNGSDLNAMPLDSIRSKAIKTIDLPRSEYIPHRNIVDYFESDKMDVIAFSCVSAGKILSEFEKELYDKGEFSEYYLVHGLGVELAEALAEIVHKQIRLDLGIARNEGTSLNDVRMKQYTGCRFSPGYPACPELELNREIFDLLRPEEFGITLSETFQIVPEQSTCAIVVPHDEAKYFAI